MIPLRPLEEIIDHSGVAARIELLLPIGVRAHGPHLLTYRQTERTFSLVVAALAEDTPSGRPSTVLAAICDDLLEASIPPEYKDASAALAVDWTDLETFSRPPPVKGGHCADPEASWGHRRNNRPGDRDERSSATTCPPR